MAILHDGHNTRISIALQPGAFGADGVAAVVFIEKEVTPPALDGGGEINITAMRNIEFRTKSPKYLLSLGNLNAKVRYDAIAYAVGNIRGVMNTNTSITLSFPGLGNLGVTDPVRVLTFQGWLNKFAPESLKEGEDPLADIEIIPSNVATATYLESVPTAA